MTSHVDLTQDPAQPTHSQHTTSTQQPKGYDDEDDDIWVNDDPLNGQRGPSEELLSDLPSVRRQHMTEGYREGLSIGKAKVMQQGFDSGYPIGVEIGLRVGTVLGILEGVVAAVGRRRGVEGDGFGKGDGGKVDEDREEGRKLYEQAKRELNVTDLMKGMDDEGVATAEGVPEQVAEVIRRWERKALGIVERDR